LRFMLTYGISLLSMLTYGIFLLSMLTYGIPTTFGRFDTNFTHQLSYFIPPQVTIFLFSIVKGGGTFRIYFSFLNLCQTAITPQVFSVHVYSILCVWYFCNVE
jgi:hypothetical protein